MTLNDDLNRMSIGMRTYTRHDVAQVDGSVYVNFDHATALTMTPEITEHGKVWYLDVTEWDRTGGVHSELDLGAFTEGDALRRAAEWLARYDREQDEIEREMNEYAMSAAEAERQWEDRYNREAESFALGRPLFPNEY